MHGRLKVRSSEEEIARKKKEHALKVKAYRSAMSKIHAKRTKQEHDDEMLALTGQILLRNPDVATLWNIRRECILKKTATAPEKEEQETIDVAKKQAIYDADLGLTEQCLMVNPKSYGGWHHRCWILENCPQANWEREMQLCNKYLKMDERNFHTWDYRRYVVAKAGVGKQQELDFCTQKIKVNFSNYSSWHYRSQLLPVLYPYEGCKGDENVAQRTMNEEKLREELEMVLTAAFTDPNDSSAWFYQRWLLGNTHMALDVCAFRLSSNQAVLAFTKPIARSDFEASITSLTADVLGAQLNWKSVHQKHTDTIWIVAIPTQGCIEFEINSKLTLAISIPGVMPKQLKLVRCIDGVYYFKAPNLNLAFSAAVVTELETQLESCNSLLEYEPDSKWTLLTSALLMHAIDRKKYHMHSLEYLQKLQNVDALRAGYYKDLASKWVLEKLLEEWQESKEFPTKLNLTTAADYSLTSLCYEQYLCIADVIELSEELKKLYDEGGGKTLHSFTTLKLYNCVS